MKKALLFFHSVFMVLEFYLVFFFARKFQTFAEMTEKISNISRFFRQLKILQKQNFQLPKIFVCINIISSMRSINNKFYPIFFFFFGFNGFCNNIKLNITKALNTFFRFSTVID